MTSNVTWACAAGPHPLDLDDGDDDFSALSGAPASWVMPTAPRYAREALYASALVAEVSGGGGEDVGAPAVCTRHAAYCGLAPFPYLTQVSRILQAIIGERLQSARTALHIGSSGSK